MSAVQKCSLWRFYLTIFLLFYSVYLLFAISYNFYSSFIINIVLIYYNEIIQPTLIKKPIQILDIFVFSKLRLLIVCLKNIYFLNRYLKMSKLLIPNNCKKKRKFYFFLNVNNWNIHLNNFSNSVSLQ